MRSPPLWATGVPLAGVRLDSGDLLDLSRKARALLDAAGMSEARIVASGDLEEGQIARLTAAGAPIDSFASARRLARVAIRRWSTGSTS